MNNFESIENFSPKKLKFHRGQTSKDALEVGEDHPNRLKEKIIKRIGNIQAIVYNLEREMEADRKTEYLFDIQEIWAKLSDIVEDINENEL